MRRPKFQDEVRLTESLHLSSDELNTFLHLFSKLCGNSLGRSFIGDLLPRVTSAKLPDQYRDPREWISYQLTLAKMTVEFCPAAMRSDEDVIQALGLSAKVAAALHTPSQTPTLTKEVIL